MHQVIAGLNLAVTVSIPDSSKRLGVEAVAHPRLGDEVTRSGWIIFELVSERLDVLTQIVALFHIGRAPDLL